VETALGLHLMMMMNFDDDDDTRQLRAALRRFSPLSRHRRRNWSFSSILYVSKITKNAVDRFSAIFQDYLD